jgi:predicted acyl esterase
MVMPRRMRSALHFHFAPPRVALLACALAAAVSAASPARAVIAIFEAPGITQGNDAVECVDQGTYRTCTSDALTERILSHDGLAPANRIPIDFQLYLPAAPANGPDGNYPLVIVIHGWGNSRTAPGGGLESEYVPYAEGGYAVLTYNERAWNTSCGAQQQLNTECQNQWNHLADVRYEVRDAQYMAGLLADELSDDGTPLVDSQRVGATGVSYGGGQSTMLATLRNRVMDPDGTIHPWTSPAGKPMQIAAAAPFWAWTDLAYSLLPNGRTLDYASNNAYRGPFGTAPFGVSKTTYVAGLYALGHASSVYAPPGQDPDLNTWNTELDAGEPYQEAIAGPIADAVTTYRSGYYLLDLEGGAVAPAPTLFNSGWADDIFPVTEPLRWIRRAKALHPGVIAEIVASDYGHARASGVDAAYAKSTAREWFDHYLKGTGGVPASVRARTQSCAGGAPAVDYQAATWAGLAPGEVRLQSTAGGTVLSSGGPSSSSAQAFDPIANGDPCARVADQSVAGTLVLDFPAPGGNGYTVLGAATVIARIVGVPETIEQSMLAARLVDVDSDGNEMLVARGIYRPSSTALLQVFQLAPMGFHVESDHHLQLELMGNEAPTMRASNVSFELAVSDIDVRIPVAEAPDGQQIHAPAEKLLPPGYLPEPGFAVLFASGAAFVTKLARRRRAQ